MPIDGHTIIFTYYPADLKYFVPLGLVFLIIPAILVICVFFDLMSWLYASILSSPFLITSICLFIYAFVMKRKDDRGVYISVSPKGVITPRNKFIPITEIDNCYIHFNVAQETGMIYKAFFNILLKSGKKKKFIFTNYIVPFDWNMKSFSKKANEILGITLFSESEVSVHKMYSSNN